MSGPETTTNAESEAVLNQVRAWFEEMGWQTEDRDPEEGLAWRLRAQNRAGQRVMAIQRSEKPDTVVLGGSVVPGGPHRQKLAALAPAVMRSFLWELRFELLRQHYQFQIQGPGIKRVAFNRVIYWDEGVSRSQFAKALEEIHHGVLTVQWMIQRLFDESPPPEAVRVVGTDPIN